MLKMRFFKRGNSLRQLPLYGSYQMINELKIRVLQTLLFTCLSLFPILEDRVAGNVYSK